MLNGLKLLKFSAVSATNLGGWWGFNTALSMPWGICTVPELSVGTLERPLLKSSGWTLFLWTEQIEVCEGEEFQGVLTHQTRGNSVLWGQKHQWRRGDSVSQCLWGSVISGLVIEKGSFLLVWYWGECPMSWLLCPTWSDSSAPWCCAGLGHGFSILEKVVMSVWVCCVHLSEDVTAAPWLHLTLTGWHHRWRWQLSRCSWDPQGKGGLQDFRDGHAWPLIFRRPQADRGVCHRWGEHEFLLKWFWVFSASSFLLTWLYWCQEFKLGGSSWLAGWLQSPLPENCWSISSYVSLSCSKGELRQ